MDRRFMTRLTAVAAFAFCSSAFAQQAPAPQPSDTDLQQFADIYVDLQETAGKYEAQLETARTEQEALDVRAKLQEESMATVTKHGWNADRYNTVARAVNADPQLAEKLVALIEERLPPTEQ